MNIIEFEGVTKTIRKNKILQNISFKIKSGEIIGLIGPSGSGKTTIMKIIADFYKPTTGEILIPASKDIGFTTQNNCFYSKLTVKENMRYFGNILGIKNLTNKITELLDFVELSGHEQKYANELSGGMLRRLDFAISLLDDPQILLIDELTAGLDPISRLKFTEKIIELNKQGKTIIISSHLLDEVEAICDRLIFIKDGISVKEGTLDDFKTNSFFEEIIIQSVPGNYSKIISTLKKYSGVVESYSIEDNKLIIYTNKISQIIHHISHAIRINHETLIELDVHKPDLNTFFKEIVEGDHD